MEVIDMVKTRKDADKVTAADMALLLGMSAAIASVISGCGATTGWSVEFGVHPVTATQDIKSLNHKEVANGQFTTLAK